MELEKLLNKLIKKGWKPFGSNDVMYVEIGHSIHFLCRPIAIFTLDGYAKAVVPLRELLGKESGLRQFVCENELYPPYIQHRWFRDRPENGLQPHDYRYWVIESALREELELERFLLDNIKVDGE